MKDWNGNKNSIYKTLGASNHTDAEREENDYYATDPVAIDKLLEVEKLSPNVWEPACGEMHLVNRLKENGFLVLATDIMQREEAIDREMDFLTSAITWAGDIVTNPPYKYAKEFVERALDSVTVGKKVCMFLKLTFLESKARKELFEKYPPKKVWVFSERVLCAKNGDFETLKAGGGSAVAYAWFIWKKGWQGNTTIGWL